MNCYGWGNVIELIAGWLLTLLLYHIVFAACYRTIMYVSSNLFNMIFLTISAKMTSLPSTSPLLYLQHHHHHQQLHHHNHSFHFQFPTFYSMVYQHIIHWMISRNSMFLMAIRLFQTEQPMWIGQCQNMTILKARLCLMFVIQEYIMHSIYIKRHFNYIIAFTTASV